VVVLIYEPDIPRCQALLASMLHLALSLPGRSSAVPAPLHLFRARASSLSFSLLPPTASSFPTSEHYDGDGSDAGEYDDDEGERPRGRPDPDVLPTLLAYKDGELARTWVRVDWEVKEDGVEGLLRREGILGQRLAPGDDLSDDE